MILRICSRGEIGHFMEDLTRRQREILDFIVERIRRVGCPPTFREIGEHFGIASLNGVFGHIAALRRKGYLNPASGGRRIELNPAYYWKEGGVSVSDIPILGRVYAGERVWCEEYREGFLVERILSGRGEGAFALEVEGESMLEAGILPGDYVVVQPSLEVRNGDIAVVSLEGETTCKRLFYEEGGIRLVPENRCMEEVFISYGSSFRVVGKVVAVFRRLP